MAHLNGRLARFELYEWVPEAESYYQVDIHDPGNMETWKPNRTSLSVFQ